MLQARTVDNPIRYEGAGLQTGRFYTVRILPAPQGSGIVFSVPIGASERVRIPATLDRVWLNDSMVSLRDKGVSIVSVEHILGILHGYRITDVEIHFDYLVEDNIFEVPSNIGDISRKILIYAFPLQSGYYEPLSFRHGAFYGENGESYHYTYGEEFCVVCTINFQNLFIRTESVYVDEVNCNFILSRARTFCTQDHLIKLQSKGFAKGAYESPIIIFKSDMSPEDINLSVIKECVYHKILDFMGDLYLAGVPVKGYFNLVNPSHRATHAFLKSKLGDI